MRNFDCECMVLREGTTGLTELRNSSAQSPYGSGRMARSKRRESCSCSGIGINVDAVGSLDGEDALLGGIAGAGVGLPDLDRRERRRDGPIE